MKIAYLIIVVIVLVVVENVKAATIELFVCKAGEEFIQNECNQCYCLNDGQLVCQINKCVDYKHKELENCITGTVWWNNCNKCWCINSGTICTINRCF